MLQTAETLLLHLVMCIAGLVVYRCGKVSGAAPLHVFGDSMSVQEDQAGQASVLYAVFNALW